MKFLITSLYLVFLQIGLAGEIKPATEDASIDCRKSIALTKTMEVYEGLPHQTKDSALFEKEIKREDITKIWNHPFYTPALWAKNADEYLRKGLEVLFPPGRNQLPSCKALLVWN